jgi:hypothetical protein
MQPARSQSCSCAALGAGKLIARRTPSPHGPQTIIECLKQACTGELPPNTKSGQSFIHDPKVGRGPEVWGLGLLLDPIAPPPFPWPTAPLLQPSPAPPPRAF